MTSRILHVIFLVCVFLLFSFSNASASIGLSIQPIKVSHTLETGALTGGVISLTNTSDQEINVEATIEDFTPAAGSSYVNFVGRAPGVTSVRDWIKLDVPENFVLAKGAAKTVAYMIHAPKNAEPGSHFGVIFFKATEIHASGQLKVGTRVGVLIFVTIPGNHLAKGNILGFSTPLFIQGGPINFNIKFENTGTVHFEPKGTIIVKNILGEKIGEVPVQGQIILPTGVKEWITRWDIAGVLLGKYSAELKLFDGEGNELTANTVSFYAFPIWYVIAFFVTVAALFFTFRFLKKNIKISIKK